MKKIVRFLTLLFAFILFSQVSIHAADKGTFGTSPKTNNGKKWRIGYYEGGPYIDYQKIFTETVRGLMKLGWIESTEIPPQKGEETVGIWNWLATEVKSNFVEFVKDAHYSAKWEEDFRKETVEKIVDRLKHKNDIDLLIAMGTWAGKDFANDRVHTPTMVLSASDPLSSGIIKSVEDSGFDHLHACLDPYRFERQIRVFHDIIGFKKLGVIYEDTVNGRSYAGIEMVEKVAKDRGFEVVRSFSESDIADVKDREDKYIKCFADLVKKVDAIYISIHGGVSLNSIPELVKIANAAYIPTFSQSGSEEVKYGFLVSISQAGFKYIGEYHAETFAKVFNGAMPNQLDQLFEEPPKIAINLKAAEIIGFNPPVDILLAADEIFRTIEVPE